MEANASPKASTLRWKILRRALLRRPPSTSDEQQQQPEMGISRKAKHGFNLIPCHLVNEENSEYLSKLKQMGSSKDAYFCYVLPTPNPTNIFLQQRVDDNVDLNDFAVCNRYNIDNTGIVCHWPSEDVLAYYCLSHADLFRCKRVIELGSGYGLAGFVIAAVTEASEVVISDGNPQVVDYVYRASDFFASFIEHQLIKRNININSSAFSATKVKSMMLHWDHDKFSDISCFDVIVASDCTFFTEFHKCLVQTINFLLKREGPAEAILFSPKRGDSLDKFLMEVKGNGLHFSITEMYDSEVWQRHERFIHGDDTWPNYETDHCYPLLIRITR